MSDARYNTLKHVALIGLPALATLYFAVASTWNIPDTKEVMGTFTAINTFVGAFVGASNLKYNNSNAKYSGTIEVLNDGDKKTFSLSLDSDPNDLEKMSDVTFKVASVPPPVSNPPQLGS